MGIRRQSRSRGLGTPRSSSIRVRTLALTISVVVSACTGGGSAARGGQRDDARPLFEARFKDFDRAYQPLAQWRGKPLLVYFWATWCESCRREVPEMIRTYRQNQAQGLQIVGIAIDQTDKVQEFVREFGIPYPMLVGGNDALALTRGIGNGLGGLPFFVAVNRKGAVVRTHLGEMPADTLDLLVRLASS